MNYRNLTILSMMVLTVITRLLPHPPNFAPITAIALFGGCYIKDKNLAMSLPLICMFVTDIFLGFHIVMPFVYMSFMLISYIGINSDRISFGTIFGSSLLFFILTNFGVWYLGYPNTLQGLISCYTLALPFFTNTILGDFFFTYVLMFSFGKLEERYPILNLEIQ